MKRIDNQQKFESLREEYKAFTFASQEVDVVDGELRMVFHFDLDQRYSFHPTMTLPARPFYHWDAIPREQLESLAFQIGMVELVSYWKLACPKVIVVKPYNLMLCQRKWWRNLYYNGLGEFRYLNGIDCSESDFVRIETYTDRDFAKVDLPLSERTIVPIGGGKDSVVTLELLRKEMEVIPLIMNPRGATLSCVDAAGYAEQDFAVVRRTLDPTMLRLNGEGFLNGHTPFSALLAFVGVLVGFGSGSRYIALSNESSANESTVPGTDINHQYSKSVQFERDFREYVGMHLSEEIQYFSFLRPLNEMQIAYLFSGCKAYHDVFRSCNAGSKTDSWCGHCPKCLFTWLILSPFMSRDRLKEIFGKDLMVDEGLRPVFEELNGTAAVKPFECVGTVEEVRACVDFMKDRAGTIVDQSPSGDASVDEILHRFNEEHFLPEKFVELLKKHIHV
ncbi:MAG: hypothetical protein K6A28_08140 [Bacteroidales bacterium]|nr:hypothetical protein [Bacteroidales bacterium]